MANILPAKEIKYHCMKCGRVDNKPTFFYRSHSGMYNNNGYMPICKDCLAILYNDYLLKYRDVYKAIKRLCMAFDIYYNQSIVESCLRVYQDSTPPIGEYLKKLNIYQNKKKTFDTTIDESFLFYLSEPEGQDYREEEVSTIPESVKARWGSGFLDDEYKMLEEHYKYLKKSNPNLDTNQEIFIMDLCQTKMQQIKAMKSGRTDDYIKLTESYRKTFAQAGLKTTPDTQESNNESWGVWMNMISRYTPEEYYKDKTLYRDFDGIGEYFKRFVLRPLKNLQFGTADRDNEYFVEDGDE